MIYIALILILGAFIVGFFTCALMTAGRCNTCGFVDRVTGGKDLDEAC